MSNTYTQIYLHIVFATKYRDFGLNKEWREELFGYIAGIVRQAGQTPIAVGGWVNHVHVVVGCNARVDIAGLVREIKVASNKWIQHRHNGRFAWQAGYGAFSVSHTHLAALRQYVNSQDKHHQRASMTDEFVRLLDVNGVTYDLRYLPTEPE